MKLNKPPVSKEQSILEGYVEFLLTDLSNVHPISTNKSTNISDLVAEKSSIDESEAADFSQQESTELNESSVVPEKSESEESFNAEVTEKMEPSAKNEVSIESEPSAKIKSEEKPKWSTIESAVIKRSQQAEEKSNLDLDKALDTNEAIDEQEIQNKTSEIIADDANRESSAESAKTVSHEYEEESEEEQLKEWDKLITEEKEAEYLAEHPEEIEEETVSSLSQDSSEESFEIKQEVKQDVQANDSVAERIASSDLAKQTREIIESYLPEEKTEDPRLQNVEKLLSRISLATMPSVAKQADTQVKVETKEQRVSQQDPEQLAQAASATFLHREAQRSKDILPEVFQTLIFQVGKLPLAVPLLKLGGIIKVSKEDITPLVGTPDWFMGLVPDDRGKLMVIDTQKYLMPEQVGDASDEYQYLIVLDNSNWALACHSVGDAKNLTTDDIRWSEKTSKRPWFAGMVVDYMSALVEVDELINMLADNIVD